jgi:MFS family permease
VTAPAPAPSTAARRPSLALIFSITVSGILANTLILAPLPDILDEFGVGDAAAGVLVAAGTVPGIVMAPVIGLLADRYGRRAVLVPCLAVFGAAGLLSAFAPTFGLLLVARLLQGFGSAGLINLAVVLIGDNWSGIERTRLIGRNAAVLTVSLVVLPAVGGLLAQLGGWRLALAPMGFALVTALAIHTRLAPGPFSRDVTFRSQLREAMVVVRQPTVLSAIAFGFVLFVLIFGLFLTTMPIHLEDEFGLGPALRGLVLAAPALGSTVAALSVGRLRARYGARRLVMGSTAIFAVAFLLVGLSPFLVLLLAATVLYGLGEGASIPTVQDHVTGSAPDASRGAVVAVFVSSVRAGQTVGPLLAGLSMVLVGTSGTFMLAGGVAFALLLAEVIVGRRL